MLEIQADIYGRAFPIGRSTAKFEELRVAGFEQTGQDRRQEAPVDISLDAMQQEYLKPSTQHKSVQASQDTPDEHTRIDTNAAIAEDDVNSRTQHDHDEEGSTRSPQSTPAPRQTLTSADNERGQDTDAAADYRADHAKPSGRYEATTDEAARDATGMIPDQPLHNSSDGRDDRYEQYMSVEMERLSASVARLRKILAGMMGREIGV